MQGNNDIAESLSQTRFEADDTIGSAAQSFEIDISEISDYFEMDARRYSRNISLD